MGPTVFTGLLPEYVNHEKTNKKQQKNLLNMQTSPCEIRNTGIKTIYIQIYCRNTSYKCNSKYFFQLTVERYLQYSAWSGVLTSILLQLKGLVMNFDDMTKFSNIKDLLWNVLLHVNVRCFFKFFFSVTGMTILILSLQKKRFNNEVKIHFTHTPLVYWWVYFESVHEIECFLNVQLRSSLKKKKRNQ